MSSKNMAEPLRNIPSPDGAPLVSVLVTSYNSEKWIAETLDSILEQTCRPLEIIVSDDASRDRTVEIVRSFEHRHPGIIRIFVQEHRLGVAENSQFVLSHATGDYVCLFASDDLMVPGKLEAQVALLERRPELAACYHDCILFDDETGRDLFRFSERMPRRPATLHNLILYNTFFPLNTVMLRRCHLPPGGYDPATGNVSDWVLMMEIAARAPTSDSVFGRLDEVYVRYRRHRANLSDAFNEEVFQCTMASLDKIQSLAPQERWAVSVARSERSMAFLIKALLSGQVSGYILNLAANIARNPVGLIYACANVWRYWRVRRRARLAMKAPVR